MLALQVPFPPAQVAYSAREAPDALLLTLAAPHAAAGACKVSVGAAAEAGYVTAAVLLVGCWAVLLELLLAC